MTDNNSIDLFLPLPEGAPEWAVVLNSNLGNVAVATHEIQQTHAKILEIVEQLKPEVMSVINGLQKNPMFKMLLGGK